MQQLDTYNQYLSLHQTFNEEHRTISRQITDLYLLPKKFMEENEKAIQLCLKNRKQETVPHHAELSPFGIRDFLFTVEDFKLQTMELFFEHRLHIDKCTVYVLKVTELQDKFRSKNTPEYEEEFVKLIPQVEELRAGLNNLLVKAKQMAKQLEVIQLRWNKIKS